MGEKKIPYLNNQILAKYTELRNLAKLYHEEFSKYKNVATEITKYADIDVDGLHTKEKISNFLDFLSQLQVITTGFHMNAERLEKLSKELYDFVTIAESEKRNELKKFY